MELKKFLKHINEGSTYIDKKIEIFVGGRPGFPGEKSFDPKRRPDFTIKAEDIRYNKRPIGGNSTNMFIKYDDTSDNYFLIDGETLDRKLINQQSEHTIGGKKYYFVKLD